MLKSVTPFIPPIQTSKPFLTLQCDAVRMLSGDKIVPPQTCVPCNRIETYEGNSDDSSTFSPPMTLPFFRLPLFLSFATHFAHWQSIQMHLTLTLLTYSW